MSTHYRQGDVLLIQKAIPAAAKPGKRDKGRIVLAYGEVTGHAHIARGRGVKIFEHEGTRYLRVPKSGGALTHEKESGEKADHDPIKLAPEEYEIRLQREYTPTAIVNVRD